MGSGKLTNITITGSNVTIMCNNSGSVYCESCDDVMIEGITWDRCGDPNRADVAGVTFNSTSNISLVNCKFQHSQLTAVSLLEVSDDILIQGCNFSSNTPNDTGVLYINRVSSPQSLSKSNITVTINEGYFCNNTYIGVPPLNISIADNLVSNCNITLKATTLRSNQIICYLYVQLSKTISFQLLEILALYTHDVGIGAEMHLLSPTSDVTVSIISSNFHSNNGNNLWCSICGNIITVMINSSNFTESKPGIFHVKIPMVYIFSAANNVSEIIFNKVQFNNNQIPIPPAMSNVDIAGTVSIFASGEVKINMLMVNFMSNQYTYLGYTGGALTLSFPCENGKRHSILIDECKFVNNSSPDGPGAALYINTENENDFIQIANTIFDPNMGGSNIVSLQGPLHPLQLQVTINASNFTNNVASSMYLSSCDVQLSGVVSFKCNKGENGGAMYLNQGTTVTIDDEASVRFFDNTASLNGGAI